MTARPVIYIDVDGVLNPFGATGAVQRPPVVDGMRRYRIRNDDSGITYTLWLSVEHGRTLTALDADIVFATTWGTQAPRDIAVRAGFPPDLPALGFEPDLTPADHNGCVKWGAVAAHCEDRPVVWIDDDHGPADHGWAETRPHPTFLVTPDPEVGLTYDEMSRIALWLTGIRETA